jgi:hypothetical protein
VFRKEHAALSVSSPRRATRDQSRLGGLMRAALYDGREITQKARDTFRASFLTGHACKVCPEVILPDDILPAERQRRADALYQAHYLRIRMVRGKKVAGTPTDDRAPAGADGGHGNVPPAA